MDAELKACLEEMRRDLRQHAESVQGRMREHVDSVEARMREHVDSVEIRMREHVDSVEIRMREHTEVVETRLLTEFWKWARTADARYRQHQGTVGALEERPGLVEDRIADLERRHPGI